MDKLTEISSKITKEISGLEEVPTKIKIFNFFYYVIKKKDINLFVYSLLLLFESLQFISYSFSSPHTDTWNINETNIIYIENIIGSPRITPLMKYIKFNHYLIIYILVVSFIFLHILFIVTIIKFNKINSSLYQICVTYVRYSTPTITMFLMIPFSELILLPLKCDNNYMDIVEEPIKCYEGLHII